LSGITSLISTLRLGAVAWREDAVYVERCRRIEKVRVQRLTLACASVHECRPRSGWP
jgi:hypothetical protein